MGLLSWSLSPKGLLCAVNKVLKFSSRSKEFFWRMDTRLVFRSLSDSFFYSKLAFNLIALSNFMFSLIR